MTGTPKANHDGTFVCLAAVSGIMLVVVLIGDLIPSPIAATVHTICTMGLIGVLMVRNILPGARLTRFLYGVGIFIMLGIILAIIILDEIFETGDELVLGMEPATAFLVIGITLFPFWFIALWVITFRRAFVTPEKERLLNQLKAERQDTQESTDG